MRSLYLRIWLTVVAALALFALVSGSLWQRHLVQERGRFEAAAGERLAAWAELVQRSLPPAEAPAAAQAEALRDWSQRLRLPMALDDARGGRLAVSDAFARREAEGSMAAIAVKLDDGRTLWLARQAFRRPLPADRPGDAGSPPFGGPRPGNPGGEPPLALEPPTGGPGPPHDIGMRMRSPGERPGMLALPPFGPSSAYGQVALVLVLFVAVAAGAYPVVRRLTRRLEVLKQGVETFGAGALAHRVDAGGNDEVAAVAATFNRAADHIEALVRSHQSLLANASHELRSPLARLKMAVAMYGDASGAQRDALRREIDTNVAELDALVEEVLLASRLDAMQDPERGDQVDLLGIAAEEGARVGADVTGEAIVVPGSERLLRRALRNLLENARRYGEQQVSAQVERGADGQACVRVCDRGPGVPQAYLERVFEPFFRMPGHAEREGGVGLGLSLVRQIARRHGGAVRCEIRPGGGSCFVISLPAT